MSVADYVSKGLGDVVPGYGQEGAPAGVAGAATAGQPVVYDPGTGLYLNKATGAVSTDPAGQQVVNDPSLATQAARNLATSSQFLSKLGEYGQQYDATQANENSLGAHLNATIAGTAPSVAQSQLEQGLSQIVQQQQSQTSGGNFSNLAGNNEQNNDTLTQSGGKNQLTTIGTLASAGGSASGIGGGGSTTSDVDEKTNVKGADREDFLSKISAATGGKGGISYDYKSPEKPGQSEGRKIGVPAQAVAKSKVGKKVVKADSDGTLKMGHGEMLGAIIGALAHLHQKVKQIG